MRLLVVEDEARLAAALQRGLQAEGFAVDVAGDGQDGLEMARHGGYDAMILDVMLPRLSGYRVVRQLRAEQNWVPVLMLSAKDGEYDQADALDVDKQVRRVALRQPSARTGGDHADGGAADGEDEGDDDGDDPAEQGTAVEDGHGYSLPGHRCEIAENL